MTLTTRFHNFVSVHKDIFVYQNGMNAPINPSKFLNPLLTAKGEERAFVDFVDLKTLWFNTGSLCNIECSNCYILSSPTADHFVYLSTHEVVTYLDEIERLGYGPIEVGLTGGEPFMNPDILEICEAALSRGHSLLVLSNAMRPMMRPRIQQGLLKLNAEYGDHLTIRVSLDHFTPEGHNAERGTGSFEKAIIGMNWLHDHRIQMTIAGRAAFAESLEDARQGFAALLETHDWKINVNDPMELVLFPEMDAKVDVPEITTACWDILNIHPDSMMCASSRMVVKRKGAERPAVLACTLLWDDAAFELAPTLSEARSPVRLNHPHCAKFCVLGGASCSG